MKTAINMGMLAMLAILCNACKSNTDFEHATKYARIYMPQATDYPVNYSIEMQDTAQTIIYGAEFGSPGKLTGDIRVGFRVNPNLVDSFNLDNGTNYAIMPEGSYQLSDQEALINAGSRQTSPLKISIKTIGYLTPLVSYLLPVSVMPPDGFSVNTSLQTAYFLIRASYVELKRSGWKIEDVDSEQKDPSLPATNLLDGDPSTFWHTEYSPERPPLPHHVTIDMGQVNMIHGLRIIGRENYTRGDPKTIIISVSKDGQNWEGGETFTTQFDQVNEETFYLKAPKEGRYFKVTVTSSYGDDNPPIAHIAEIYAF